MYAAAARDLSAESNEQKLAKHLQDFKAKLKSRLPDKVPFEAGFCSFVIANRIVATGL